MNWQLRPNEYIVNRKKKTLRAYRTMLLPEGSLQDLCTHTGDWKCCLEIDYFHTRIKIQSLPRILGSMYTIIGGSQVKSNRDFPVTRNDRGIARPCMHLDLVCSLPFRVQLYLHEADDVRTARRIIISVFDKYHRHFVKPKPIDANLCEVHTMVPTRILMESLQYVQRVIPSCELFLNQYGGKYSWSDFQKDFRDVVIPSRHNLWDLTMTMRHKSGCIIMFRRKRNASSL